MDSAACLHIWAAGAGAEVVVEEASEVGIEAEEGSAAAVAGAVVEGK